MKVLLVTPPMQETNSPYPATTMLTGFLRGQGYDVVQDDFAIRVVSRIFSRVGLRALFEDLREWLDPARRLAELAKSSDAYAQIEYFLTHHEDYEAIIDQVIRYLRKSDPALKHLILRGDFFPQAPGIRERTGRWDSSGTDDQRALRYCAAFRRVISLLVSCACPDFDYTQGRYCEVLGEVSTFTAVENRLATEQFVDRVIEDVTRERMAVHHPDVLGITVPFPGQFYSALRIAKAVKELRPEVAIVIGGGFCNTTLRELSDPRVFRYVDYVTLDDGERVLQCLVEHLEGKRPRERLLRTFALVDGEVKYFTSDEADIPHAETGTPTYKDLPLDLYIPRGPAQAIGELPLRYQIELSSWNKLMLAHGCYWGRCAFCDTHLDYIGRYARVPAKLLVDRMESIASETGWSGFHFVDEAAPPSVLKALSRELVERKLHYAWWGNIRFDKAFTPELATEMARAGCISISAGLEVASERLLKLMDKGVTIEQVARVCRAFRDAKISVNAYLMYGFPTQTEQEIVDALEVTRQFFANRLLTSAAWHYFQATAHSPIGRTPERFGVTLHRQPPPPQGRFANYIVEHTTTTFPHRETGMAAPKFKPQTRGPYETYSRPLWSALINFERGERLDADVSTWFLRNGLSVPKTSISPDLIAGYLRDSPTPRKSHRHLPLLT